MSENHKVNPDVLRIQANMGGFVNDVGKLATCYRQKNPTLRNPLGIVVVGLNNPSGKKEIDHLAKKNRGIAPFEWQPIDPQRISAEEPFQFIRGYHFT
jgi:hypothetical protein